MSRRIWTTPRCVLCGRFHQVLVDLRTIDGKACADRVECTRLMATQERTTKRRPAAAAGGAR